MKYVNVKMRDGSHTDYFCNHTEVSEGVLRLEKRPNSQQRAVGMNTVEHVVSIPIDTIASWKEID